MRADMARVDTEWRGGFWRTIPGDLRGCPNLLVK
jgi:hypothetical protein